MNHTNQFMVDFTLPSSLSPEFLNLIPEQRIQIGILFKEGVLNNYMLSLDNHKLWAVFTANSEYDVMQMIAELPLTTFMQVSISMLSTNKVKEKSLPSFSLN